MKRFNVFVLAIAVILMFNIAVAQEEAPADPVDVLLQKVLAIYNDGKVELISEVFTEDCVLHHSSFPEPKVGIAAMTEFIEGNKLAFSDFKLMIDKFYISGDMYWNFWEASGTHSGPMGEIEATGNYMKVWGLSAMIVVDGKIAEEWIVFNAVTLQNQLNPPDVEPPGDVEIEKVETEGN